MEFAEQAPGGQTTYALPVSGLQVTTRPPLRPIEGDR